MSGRTITISETISGSREVQGVIKSIDLETRLILSRRLDKPGEWTVMDTAGERLGFLGKSSLVAKRLKAGARLVHAAVSAINEPKRDRATLSIQASFVLVED